LNLAQYLAGAMLRRAAARVMRALPKPPYAEARYWDKVYADTFGAQGALEWGTPPEQLLRYQYVDEHGERARPGSAGAAATAHARPHGASRCGAVCRDVRRPAPAPAPGAVCEGALADHAPKDADVLVVGCGNSQLSEELATRGWDPARIVSVDFSASSIEQAAGRARERAHSDERLAALRFCVADCRSLHENFPAASFDCAVDKGG